MTIRSSDGAWSSGLVNVMALAPATRWTRTETWEQQVALAETVSGKGSAPATSISTLRRLSPSRSTANSVSVYVPVVGTVTPVNCKAPGRPMPSQRPRLRTIRPPDAPGYESTQADPDRVLPGASASYVTGANGGGGGLGGRREGDRDG